MKMKINGFIILFLFNIVFCQDYKYDVIKEYIPKSSLLFIENKSFKIYEYTPSCEDIFNISFDIFYNFKTNFFLYEEYENITQDDDGNFINYYDKRNLGYFYHEIISYKDLICKKKYYLILVNAYRIPSSYKISIIDERNTINLNPSLSNEYSFNNIYNEVETFIYKYNENKNVLINFNLDTNITIYENENIVYNNETNESINLLFKKNIEYKIIISTNNYNSYIDFQFFEESKYIKYDFVEQNSILLFQNTKYIFEIDISKYKTGEYIFFLINGEYSFDYYIKYQYKNKFNGNNFINFGDLLTSKNYACFLQINKEENNNIILYVESNTRYNYFFNMLNYDIKEITSSDSININKPTILYLDHYNFNNYNSFGIYSNNKFFFVESEVDEGDIYSQVTINFYSELCNIIINKKDFWRLYQKKRALIFLDVNNKNNQTTFIEFKKYNFPIFYGESKINDIYYSFSQYYQFYEGDESKSEFYFYLNYNSKYLELFYTIYGDYIGNFIREEDIKSLSDLNFDKFNETNFFNTEKDTGFLRIKSNIKPSMFKFTFFMDYEISSQKLLEPGNKYYFLVNKINYLTINSSYIGVNIPLKFRVFGLKQEQAIALILNDINYTLTNSDEFKINFYYEKNNSQLIHFDGKIERNYIIEIVIGFIDLDSCQIIDFKDSIGDLPVMNDKVGIIRIPKDLDEKFYDFTIFTLDSAYIEITYDETKYAVPDMLIQQYKVTELFKTNPYSKIKKEENKFLYITIKYGRRMFSSIYIKKQYPYSSTLKFNNINLIPKTVDDLHEEDSYYYKIKIPKTDYNYLTIQTYKRYWQLNYISTTYNEFIFVETKNIKHNYQNIKKDNNESIYINYFDTKHTNFINLVPKQKYYLDYFNHETKQHNISQIEGTNKIKVTVQSLKYYYNINILFYLVLNWENTGYNPYEVISGDKNYSDIKIIIFEDNGKSEIIEYEAEIDVDFKHQNISNFIVPIEKETNIIRTEYITERYFDFIYHSNKAYIYFIIGGACLLVIIIAIIIIIIYKKKKKKKVEEELNIHGPALLEKAENDIN